MLHGRSREPSIQQDCSNALVEGTSIHKKFSGSLSQNDKAVIRRGAHRAGLISTEEDEAAWK